MHPDLPPRTRKSAPRRLRLLVLLLILASSCSRSSAQEDSTATGTISDGQTQSPPETFGRGQEVALGDAAEPDVSSPPDTSSRAEDTTDVNFQTDTQNNKLPAYCKTDLPKPGGSCDKLGEIRCTNYGAGEAVALKSVKICNRPYYVECKPAHKGGPIWTIARCPGTGGSNPIPHDPCGSIITCYEEGTTSLGCVPMGVRLSGGQPPKNLLKGAKPVPATQGMWIQRCVSTNTLKQYLPGAPPVCSAGGQSQCLTIDELGTFKSDYLKAAGACAKYLETGYWFFPLEVCASTLTCPAKNSKCSLPMYKDNPGCKEYFQPKCWDDKLDKPFRDPDTGEIRCMKDCEEVGAPGY